MNIGRRRYKKNQMPGRAAHTCNPSTGEIRAPGPKTKEPNGTSRDEKYTILKKKNLTRGV
jgi:hypothetical protein